MNIITSSWKSVLRPRFGLWALFVGALLLGVSLALLAWPAPPLDLPSLWTLAILAAGTLAAEVFWVDFPDRKHISGSYIFPLLASALVAPPAGAVVAGGAALAAGLLRPPRARSALFHGPQLAMAALAAAAIDVQVFGGVPLELSLTGAYAVLLYMGAYTTVAWALGRAEEMLAEKPAGHAAVDLLTNLMLTPLPLALSVVYERTQVNGLLLSSLALALLLIVVRSYVNLSTLHGELRQAYARLAEQEQRLESALATNREMSQVVSHDLRGPLTSVIGYAELLKVKFLKDRADEKQLSYLESIEGNSRRILSLADKLLDLHRLDEGGEVELAVVDFARVLRQLVEDLRVRADEKGVTVQLELDAHASLLSSEWMVREIAENLLSNAIKYSRDGGRVAVRLRPDGSDDIRFEVEDDGIGMSAADRERLFTKFFRSADEQVRKVRGTGLGLALTKTMIERLHGRVEVWSEHGQGSRFTVWLPLTPGSA
jgi:signal transduction histidine kinase